MHIFRCSKQIFRDNGIAYSIDRYCQSGRSEIRESLKICSMRNCDILGKKEQCANKLIILRRINIRLSVIFVLVLVLSPAEIDYYTAPPHHSLKDFLNFLWKSVRI
jgi:hypothetical protein